MAVTESIYLIKSNTFTKKKTSGHNNSNGEVFQKLEQSMPILSKPNTPINVMVNQANF